MPRNKIVALLTALVLAGLGQPMATAAGPPGALSVLADGDVDEDGIPDEVELNGIKHADGSLAMDLPKLGASPCRKTILVEIDYMADSTHDHRPDLFSGPTGLPHPDLGVNDTRFEDNGHNHIAVGNVDGDAAGKQEIVLADASEGGRIHVYDATTHTTAPGLGVADSTFEDDGRNQMAVGDVNGDGRDEIVIANADTGRIDVLDAVSHAPAPGLGVGDTRFDDDEHNQIAVGNVDGDAAGKQEIVLADASEGGRIHVYDATTHTTAPGLGVRDTTFDDDDHNQLAVGDVNGDGRDDVLIANDSTGRIDVLDATTHANVPDTGIPDTTFDNDDHNQIATGDLDGDGQDEVLVANDSGGRIDVFDATTGKPNPRMGITDTRFNNSGHNQLAAGNVDGDSHHTAEALIADASEGGQIQVFDAKRPAGPIEEVAAAFANAPVPAVASCPYAGADAEPGVQLIVDVSGTIPEQPVFDPSDFTGVKADPANFDPARDPYVHYNLWVHDYGFGGTSSESSGLSTFTGDKQDFMVSLGAFAGGNGTLIEQAGTFMHELGHSLGLHHGGDEPGVNYKPNYLSVMNYSFQLTGLTGTTGKYRTGVDYSGEELSELDALHLSEQTGVEPDTALFTRWRDAARDKRTGAADQPIDWNGDGSPDDADVPVAVNGGVCVRPGPDGVLDSTMDPMDQPVNNLIISGGDLVCDSSASGDDVQVMPVGEGRFLRGFDDWSHLKLDADPAPVSSPPAELTAAEAETIQQSHDQALAPDRNVQLQRQLAGYREPVLGVAMDDTSLYATHYYETAAEPHTSDQPGSLVVLDRATLRPKARVPVGYRPRSVAVNTAGDRIYVLNGSRPGHPNVNELTVIDRRTLSVITTISIATAQTATDVVVNPRTNRVYVSNNLGLLHVIDGAANTELPPINMGVGPLGMAVDESTNTIYVAMSRPSASPPVTALGSVTDDGVTRTIHPQVPLGPVGTQPTDVAVDPFNNRLYTANLGGGPVHPSVTVLELSTREIIKQVNLSGPARAIAVSPHAHQAYVAGEGRVDVVGQQSLSVVRTIPANNPFSVVTGIGDDRRLYVGDVRNGGLGRLAYSSGSRK
ncbi:hypothetical protein Aple_012200 [Acrocarpospora pleiomorpha]|uniref:Uncharacterized protein n=1 Tax=Acrocarpospora pleiomorpha TaxID=90975 RepID=A0A5M3X9B6_9ACTN|nr:FG-GAP-like repeat-containing protein [Acrocarpospora pleiomorpha]GES18325.1 hypothetical protein Aple_012200 [Acrocarpospora pleiomorpha]